MRLLLIGVCLGGFTTGAMVGLSSSPIAGAVIPALVSGVVAGIGLFFKNPLDAQVSEILKLWNADELKESTPPKRRWLSWTAKDVQTEKTTPDPALPEKREAVLNELSRLKEERKQMPKAIGLFLILFFVLYAVGLPTGYCIRSANEAISTPHVLIEKLENCKSINEAFRAIEFHQQFQSQGIPDRLIAKLLALPDYEPTKPGASPTDFKRLPEKPAPSENPSASPTPQPTGTSITVQTPSDYIHSPTASLKPPPHKPNVVTEVIRSPTPGGNL